MEKIIKELSVDKVTKEKLQGVKKNKDKFDSTKRTYLNFTLFTCAVVFFFLWYFYRHIVVPSSDNFYLIFTSSLHDLPTVVLLGAVILLAGRMNYWKQETDKKEKEYHDLRREISNKLDKKDSWIKRTDWENRYQTFEVMKSEYDINLFYESK